MQLTERDDTSSVIYFKEINTEHFGYKMKSTEARLNILRNKTLSLLKNDDMISK